MTDELVTYHEAGRLVGGDRPKSAETIRRMVKRGELDAVGSGNGRRITMQSIREYQRGERWHEKSARPTRPRQRVHPRAPEREIQGALPEK